MNIAELQEMIMNLKKKNDFCILAHSYQSQDILEIADYSGDSYGLSLKAREVPQKNILMCGVRFMAETVKILSPDKNVFLSHHMAGCPMAGQIDAAGLSELRQKYPDHTAVAYINTSASLKTIADVCVTSSSAVRIVKNIPNDKILFVPDCNLGAWVAGQVPEKEFVFFSGGCPAHMRIKKEDVLKAKRLHPQAEILVHPECLPEVSKRADYIGSTSGIMNYAIHSPEKEFIIGTENSIVQHLQFQCPDKKIYALSRDCICHNMKITSLMDVFNCIDHCGGEEILLDKDTRIKASRCLENMLRFSS